LEGAFAPGSESMQSVPLRRNGPTVFVKRLGTLNVSPQSMQASQKRSAILTIRALFLAIIALANMSFVHAEGRQYGAWNVGAMSDNEGLYAGTVNDSNGIFSQYCLASDASCYWILGIDIDCEIGNKYPTLVNSDAGASYQEIYCFKIGGKPRFAFANFDAIDGVVKASRRISIAFPMQGGQFKVSRFALDGASEALEVMIKAAKVLLKKDVGTKDTTL
jgi:hypothetical protein